MSFDAKASEVYSSITREEMPEFMLGTTETYYIIPRYNAYYEETIQMDNYTEQHLNLRFSKLTQTTIDLHKTYYWRFIYPIDSNEWLLKIMAMPYADEFGSHHFYNLINTELDGHKMNLFSFSMDNRQWMVIESKESVTYEEMDHLVLSMTVPLGFLIGKRYGNYRFNLASNDLSFSIIVGVEALALQKTKYCPFQIICYDNNTIEKWLEQYDYQKYALEEYKRSNTRDGTWLNNIISIVPMDTFSSLSQLCYKSNDFLLATSMLVDGCLMNIEYQKPFFCLALETITSVLMNESDNKDLLVMPKEDYNQKVAPVLIEAVNGLSDISDEAKETYSNRIRFNINNATNNYKLESLYQKYGYNLTSSDKEAIRKRNSSFHGHISSETTHLRSQRNDMLEISLRLHKLCSILLLKSAGFSGKVLNNEVLFGMKAACERKESVFVDI